MTRCAPVLLAIILAALTVALLAADKPTEPQRYEANASIMGSTYTIAAFGEHRGQLASAVRAAFDEARRIDRLLSNYKPDSELSRINREASGRPIAISSEMADLLSNCLEYSRASDGAFDITVGALMKVWGFYKGSGELPYAWQLAVAAAARSGLSTSPWTAKARPSASSGRGSRSTLAVSAKATPSTAWP